MITVTPDAAIQIQQSAKESGITDAILRIAIKQLEDGSLHYAMGFDDAISETDLRFENEGINLVIAEVSQSLAKDMTLDYVVLDNGEKNFIFINPNDKNYSPAISG
ncbi:MAG: iron-sulfur cluster assembly accessory protein [Gammaproteobacteria bacterium]|nr:iron-sulfur cluster assembly accessory protein [Gammaproteobacteria bacterium]